MNDLSGYAKSILEASIRRGAPRTLDHFEIVAVSAFAFMKAAVLDWSQEDQRGPRIPRAVCTDFRTSLVSDLSPTVRFPDGLQVWLASYNRSRKMEARSHIDELVAGPPLKGHIILVITYLVGSFVFQLTFPSWPGPKKKRLYTPTFDLPPDRRTVLIWPDVPSAKWPPVEQLSGSTFGDFRERLRRVRHFSMTM
jgi:hypothetical protein